MADKPPPRSSVPRKPMRDGKEPVSDGTRGDGIAGRVGIGHVPMPLSSRPYTVTLLWP
jgi:hypothetical protein